jgi:hypothetical protein
MPTTFPQIRDVMVQQLQALIPPSHSEQRFDLHRVEDDFDAWVESQPTACFRRFELVSNLDYDIVGTTEGFVDTFRQSLTLSLAYPRQMARYGAANRRALDDVIDQDFLLVEGAIGRRSNASWPQGLHSSQFLSMQPVRLDGAWIVRLVYEIQYDRSV